jgi:hypothetical protein
MPVSIVGVDGAEEGQAGLVGGFLKVFLPAGLVAPAGVLVALLGNYFDQQDIAAAPAVAQAPERLDVLLGVPAPGARFELPQLRVSLTTTATLVFSSPSASAWSLRSSFRAERI